MKYLLLLLILPLLAACWGGPVGGTAQHAASNCTLIVPANPLSARGLATPYQLATSTSADGPCDEANPHQSAFVQADIYDPATGQITTYSPLVIDQNAQPAIAPNVPTLPAHAVIGLWFGFNGSNLTLSDTQSGSTLQQAFCINDLNGSLFGAFAYCNAIPFFDAVNQGIARNMVKIPPLGRANDGLSCPTTRDFAIVDQDQSDSVQTQYLVSGIGQMAQFSAANQAHIQHTRTISNLSDHMLLTRSIDPALGCQPWQVPNLSARNTYTSTLATDELQAASQQSSPVALIPVGSPMALYYHGKESGTKLIYVRAGVDQPITPLSTTGARASTTTYCQNLLKVALPRLQRDMANFQQKPSPDGGASATSLYTFLAARLHTTLGANGLNCVGLLHIPNPVALITNRQGVVTSVTVITPPSHKSE